MNIGQGKQQMMVKSSVENRVSSVPLRKAFLIRCWQQEGVWRFMLEDVSTRERQLFVGMAEMTAWVTAVLDLTAAGDK